MRRSRWLTAATVLVLPAGVMPARSQSLPPALEACSHIRRDADRLACFDREAAAASRGTSAKSPPAGTSEAPAEPRAAGASSTTSPAATPPAASPPPASPLPASQPPAPLPAPLAAQAAPASLTPEQKLGLSPEGVRKLEAKQGVKMAPEVKNLTAHIASVSRTASGRMVMTLDNGQVWRQSESRSTFEAPQPGELATISHGALGSFWLATGKHNWTRVERIP
jgi:hypothetical protein